MSARAAESHGTKPYQVEPFRYAIGRFFGSLDPLPASFIFVWFVSVVIAAPIFSGAIAHAAFGHFVVTAASAVLALASAALLIRDIIRWHFSRAAAFLVSSTIVLLGAAWFLA